MSPQQGVRGAFHATSKRLRRTSGLHACLPACAIVCPPLRRQRRNYTSVAHHQMPASISVQSNQTPLLPPAQGSRKVKSQTSHPRSGKHGHGAPELPRSASTSPAARRPRCCPVSSRKGPSACPGMHVYGSTGAVKLLLIQNIKAPRCARCHLSDPRGVFHSFRNRGVVAASHIAFHHSTTLLSRYTLFSYQA
ncbi:hypothetical protein EJ04DRAFT_237651 [Polyplosphaeria fusca]|uniref:Uncharacterized protein n=1 Tax=Polyplosphaeria fusca TaxID=682080 RepID=A0A9P4RB32_9PLEO|nr:hypothetical protein EJ04DRAFT_237651 [Polyplosphaeria fusca]